jgi:eukaryotic-like serine/threonine-protein kinase
VPPLAVRRPNAAEAFAEAAAASRLLSAPVADALAKAARAPGASAKSLAEQLVGDGKLTAFQAEKLLAGQWHGLILGPFRILEPLGRGGLGVVYRASSPERPELALKILPPKKAEAEPRTKGRFEREMMLGQLVPRHTHLCQVYSVGRANGVRYIALEYVPGSTLRTLVLENGPLPIAIAAAFFVQVAEGLAAAHDAGLVHRDFKPANVMLTPEGSAKLLDFGFALRIGEEVPADPTVLGGPGYAVGTMDYIAPEQAADAAKATPASDQYSLGCSLYFALAGCPPFPGGTPLQKIRWHRSEPPPPIRSLNAEVPAELAAVLDRLMAKDPAERFADALAVAVALRRFAADPERPLPVAKRIEPVHEIVELTEDDVWDGEAPGPEPDEPSEVVHVVEDAELPAWLWVAAGAFLCFLAAVMGFLARYLTQK